MIAVCLIVAAGCVASRLWHFSGAPRGLRILVAAFFQHHRAAARSCRTLVDRLSLDFVSDSSGCALMDACRSDPRLRGSLTTLALFSLDRLRLQKCTQAALARDHAADSVGWLFATSAELSLTKH